MTEFSTVLGQLNAAQRAAVEQTEGPLLVVAGPGTGKTQLLSARVAHILASTDTLPQNILCLTFTESGADNMRERLTRFIGAAGYEVTIGTYHAFGGDLIRRFPEYFSETRLQNPVDELGKHQIVRTIVDDMSYRNPLKAMQYHLNDLIATLSEVKRGLLDEAGLRALAQENQTFIAAASAQVREVFGDMARLPGKFAASQPYFEQLLAALQPLIPPAPADSRFGSLAALATAELAQALETAAAATSSKPLTAWKTTWLVKDATNHFIFGGEQQNKRIEALAAVFAQYQAALAERGLYDFDDMILRAIQALEAHADLRYTLQEQYLYLLLDEFQDTNAAQLKLIQLLTNNPVSEGRPNVMAVGDDDQAIYAFQGAQYSNMLDFFHMYHDTTVINLTDNYRSQPDILHVAHEVAGQIASRLDTHFAAMSKDLVAHGAEHASTMSRQEFVSDVAQYAALAEQIEQLIAAGETPSDIAVLAPRHRYLEPLVPFLSARGIPVRYEKRENILEAPVVRELLAMARLTEALRTGDEVRANQLWPHVLSFDFWGLPVSTIWRLSWRIAQDKHSWSQTLVDEPECRAAALLFLAAAHRAESEPLEPLLDYLIGTAPLATREVDNPTVRSPLRAYYTGPALRTSQPEVFYHTLSHLNVLRAKLREHQAANSRTLMLHDLLQFVDMYDAAGERMQSTSPYNQQAEAVQLMTVFKAKGLEFNHVFLPSCQDDVWGERSRGNANRLTLPANLAPIRHAGAGQDERLRIFFVAITRARHGLHFMSYLHSYAGKATTRLKYLHEQTHPDGSIRSLVLPAAAQTVQANDTAAPPLQSLEYSWHDRHLAAFADTQLRDVLDERLRHYQLSPTHLTTFIDMKHGGPEAFFMNTILRFPQAPGLDAHFGSSMHETLEWLQHQADKGSLPADASVQRYFDSRLHQRSLTETDQRKLQERGEYALTAYLAQHRQAFQQGNAAEYDFRNEGVVIDGMRLGGKVDRLDIDRSRKTITVVDYKTGKSFDRWTSDLKLHKYRLQLYCYKLLVEHSRRFRGYRVERGRLEFIEPDDTGTTQTLELAFNDSEAAEVTQLLAAMWQRVQALDFPDTSTYDHSLTGTRAFEQDLLAGADTQST